MMCGFYPSRCLSYLCLVTRYNTPCCNLDTSLISKEPVTLLLTPCIGEHFLC